MLTDKPMASYPTRATPTDENTTGKSIEPNQQCTEIARERIRLRNAEHRHSSYPMPYDSTGWEQRERDYNIVCRNERHFRDRGGATYVPGEEIGDC